VSSLPKKDIKKAKEEEKSLPNRYLFRCKMTIKTCAFVIICRGTLSFSSREK